MASFDGGVSLRWRHGTRVHNEAKDTIKLSDEYNSTSHLQSLSPTPRPSSTSHPISFHSHSPHSPPTSAPAFNQSKPRTSDALAPLNPNLHSNKIFSNKKPQIMCSEKNFSAHRPSHLRVGRSSIADSRLSSKEGYVGPRPSRGSGQEGKGSARGWGLTFECDEL